MTTATVRSFDLFDPRGFTIAELLIAMTVTLAVTGAAFTAMRDAAKAGELAAVVSDVNQNLRIAINVVIRDLVQAGEGDYSLRTGVPIPSGAGVDPVVRPGPPTSGWVFPATYTALPAVSPANGLGPLVNGVATDVVTLLFENRSLDLTTVMPAIAAGGESLTFPAGFDMGTGSSALQRGDLIRFGNGAMQEVTLVDGRTLRFDAEAPSNLNQREAPQGSVTAIPGFPALAVSRISMITYYLKVADTGVPQLIRRVNYGEERAVAIGVENFQLSWDLVNGVTNPTNVEAFSVDGSGEGQIRKANLYMAARSQDELSSAHQPLRTGLSTQVSLRSLAFVSRYDLVP